MISKIIGLPKYIWNFVSNVYYSYPNLTMGIILVIIGVICLIYLRKKIYKLMVDAETGALTAEGLSHVISKIQESDWDDRMVLVVAKLITSLPILKFLPTKYVAKVLNKMVQSSFDKVKDLLKARTEKLKAEMGREISEEEIKLVKDTADDLYAKINLALLAKFGPGKNYTDAVSAIAGAVGLTEEVAKVTNVTEKIDTLQNELEKAITKNDVDRIESMIDTIEEDTLVKLFNRVNDGK